MPVVDIPFVYRARYLAPRARNVTQGRVLDSVPVMIRESAADAPIVAIMKSGYALESEPIVYRLYDGALWSSLIGGERKMPMAALAGHFATTIKQGRGSRFPAIQGIRDFAATSPADRFGPALSGEKGDEIRPVPAADIHARRWDWDDRDQRAAASADLVSRHYAILDDVVHVRTLGPCIVLVPDLNGELEASPRRSLEETGLELRPWAFRCDRIDAAVEFGNLIGRGPVGVKRGCAEIIDAAGFASAVFDERVQALRGAVANLLGRVDERAAYVDSLTPSGMRAWASLLRIEEEEATRWLEPDAPDAAEEALARLDGNLTLLPDGNFVAECLDAVRARASFDPSWNASRPRITP